MKINVTFDSSVASAPAGFVQAVDYVVALFDTAFANPVTINLDVGWGEVDGQKLDADALGESLQNGENGYSYAEILSALTGLSAKGDTIPTAALPATDPTAGGVFVPGDADAQALGLLPATPSEIDGWVGLSSVPGTFTFDPSNRAVTGEFDAIGTLEHEITEVMGRVAGTTDAYSVLDLYRYSAPGALDLTWTHRDYFSIDGGVHDLDNFNHDPEGDLGDWANTAGADSFLAFSGPGVDDGMTTADLQVMAAIGWIDVIAPSVVGVFQTAATGELAAGKVVTLALDFNEAVTVTGTPSLMLAGGETATYTGGSGGHALLFSYTVGAGGVAASDLAPTAVNLAGGAILDPFGNAAQSLTLGGSAGVDRIIFGTAGQTLSGDGGNDVFFIGAGGGETVNGGAGQNTVVFTGPIGQYSVSNVSGAIVVGDSVPDRDGTDTLNNVQLVKFSDITLVFNLHSSQDLLVYELYQAAYSRVPDLPGFQFWAGAADADNLSATTLADAFLAAPEFSQKYGANLSNTAYVTELYENVLARPPDQAGLDYWVGQANAGAPRDQLLVDFAVSAENVHLIAPHTSDGYWTT